MGSASGCTACQSRPDLLSGLDVQCDRRTWVRDNCDALGVEVSQSDLRFCVLF